MKKINIYVCLLMASRVFLTAQTDWSLFLEQPGAQPLFIRSVSFTGENKIEFTESKENFEVTFNAEKKGFYWYYSAQVKSLSGNQACYLSFSKKFRENKLPYGFFGEVQNSNIYRQSPHEPKDHRFKDLPLQAIPMVAVRSDEGLEILLNNTPAVFDNYTTQTYDLENREIKLSSGDNGFKFAQGAFQLNADNVGRREKGLYRIEPHYFTVNPSQTHRMDGLFVQTRGNDVGSLREAVNMAIAMHWSNGTTKGLFGSTFFSTAYMCLRANETNRSKYWVVPAIGYSNKQYTRDAFWISMVLPAEYSGHCYENEASKTDGFEGAERQLFTLVWAYRNVLNGYKVDTVKLQKILTIIERQSKNGYYSGYSKNAGVEGCFQGQADQIAYEKDDAIANNQGLFVTALMCAEKMGLTTTVPVEQARRNYENLFRQEIGGFSMSRLKNSQLAADALMGDLLAQVYLGKALLPSAKVLTHYETMKRVAKTEYGFKNLCNVDGSYLKQEQYDSPSFKSAITKVNDGEYMCGGSWYLYDMLLLMDAYLHGAKDAEDLMIWRTKLEFELGGSAHEFINTASGKATQPNYGWNAGVYALWSELVKQGRAPHRFLDEIDNNKNHLNPTSPEK